MTTIKRYTRATAHLTETLGLHATLYTINVLLRVFSDEGVTMKDIETDLQLYSATLSNIVKKLSRYRTKKGLEGLNLVHVVQDLDNRRRFALYLTDKGKALRDELERLLTEE